MIDFSLLNLNCRLLKINCLQGRDSAESMKVEGDSVFLKHIDIIQSSSRDIGYWDQISNFPSHTPYLYTLSLCIS